MSPARYHRRDLPPPPLPDPSTLPFPGELIRGCESCYLRKNCRAPVPGDGPRPARIALVGQNPAETEMREGRPFAGQAGRYLDSLLFQCGLSRETVFVSNVVHCLTPGNRTVGPTELQACRQWIDLELSVVQPKIIMAMGAPSIAYFLGNNAGTVEHLHGKPVEVDGVVIIPAYHPAAALHNTNLIRQCQEDFNVLRSLVNGADWRDFHVRDEFPSPDYREVTYSDLSSIQGDYAVDTETFREGLWSVQVSDCPGKAYFLPVASPTAKVDLTHLPGIAIMHNYPFDSQFVEVDDDRFLDTMTMAYLTGQNSQGLKELASRLCGMEMRTYREVVRPEQQKLALEYLLRVNSQSWPDPPPIEETKWNNKKGELVTRNKKPWHISRKVSGMLKSYSGSPDTVDLWEKWHNIPAEERSVVEGVVGPMPESTLADISHDDAVAYANRDPDATIRVHNVLKKQIEDLDLDYVLAMDTGILPMVCSMMRTGMAVNVDHLRRLSEDYDVRMRVKALELAEMVGHPFNPNSSQQVAAVVYGELGFAPTAFTPTGLISTDDQELKKTGHPVAKGVIEYRGIQKLKSTYADALRIQAAPDSEGVPRVHTTIKTTRTETGRLSSADPNLQNIPTRNKDSKAIKSGFIAPAGWLLAEVDYSQIEMVTQAHLAKCRGLIDLFLRGDDPHTVTASQIFGVPYEEAKKSKYRYPTKRFNFGLIYLISAQGMADQIAEYISDLEMAGEPVDVDPWSVDDCERFRTDWYTLYPEVKDYQMQMAATARRYGYVRDLFGRTRWIPEVSCPIRSIQEAGLRMAANMPVQATAADIIKLAMGELWRGLPKTEWADMVRWLMTIHDSLLFELRLDGIDRDHILACLAWIEKVMTGVVELLVPIKVDTKLGYNWGTLKSVEEVLGC